MVVVDSLIDIDDETEVAVLAQLHMRSVHPVASSALGFAAVMYMRTEEDERGLKRPCVDL